MEFKTALTPEQVKQRLSHHARPLNYSNTLTADQFLARWNNDNTFYLLKIGRFPFFRPLLPFVGRVEIRGDETVITGKFALTKKAKVGCTCFFAFAWVLFFLTGASSLFRSGADVMEVLTYTITTLVILSLWTGLCVLFIRYLPTPFQREMRSEVVAFIRRHLCRE